jgi:diguanylate cyclase (GGDEF)-like protein
MPSMSLYYLLDRIFPKYYHLKLFFVAFIGTHVPLIAMTIWALASNGGISAYASTIVLLLLATVVGTAGTLAGLWFVLAPVKAATDALTLYRERRVLPQLPLHHLDHAGRLMAGVTTVTHEVERLTCDLERAALIDPLTGLTNRRGFERVSPVGFAAAEGGMTIFVAVIDLDRFKSINDTYGHIAGDRVLQAAADVIRRNVRKGDIVARLGGEEFVVVSAATDVAVAATVCERIRAGMNAINALPVRVTASVGLARIEGSEPDFIHAIARADAALYRAKETGRNRLVIDSSCQTGGSGKDPRSASAPKSAKQSYLALVAGNGDGSHLSNGDSR